MDYIKKSVKTGKALYTAVDGAIRNPDQFLHGQQQQQQQQQHYQQQQIPQGQGQPQHNLQQHPPFPPRPGAQPYNNGPNHSVSYQPQTTGYIQSPQLPPRPQTVDPYPQQQAHRDDQQSQQYTGYVPSSAPYTQTPHPANSQLAWPPPQHIFSSVQPPSQPPLSPTQPPPQAVTLSPMQQPPAAFTPNQFSQPYSPPPTSAFSPPLPSTQSFSQMSPVTSAATPVSQPFSPTLPPSTVGTVSPQLSTHTYSFPQNNGQYHGQATPPPPTQNPTFGSHAGLALNPYHAPSAIPSSGPIVPKSFQSPQLPNSYDEPSGPVSPPPFHSPELSYPYDYQPNAGHQQITFIAELPEDNFASQAVELPAEVPADLFPSSKPAEHNEEGEGFAHARSPLEHNVATRIGKSGKSVDIAHGQPGSSPDQSPSTRGETPITPPSTVTAREQVQQPTPLHPQTSSVPATHTTHPPYQWQPPACSPLAVYNPSIFPPMPGSPQSQPAPFQQAQSGANTSAYIAYLQPQQPAPYQQPHTENQGYVAYGQQQQQQQYPAPQPAYSIPAPVPYSQPVSVERMGSLAQRAQQMSLNSEPSAQFPYRATGSEDHKAPLQQPSFGLLTGYAPQNQTHQVDSNVNAPGYHPHGPPPPYM
ncbi:hypothetical protein E2P81_ATG06772 [Venturia nashicola]|nr:hypothetical protein E2P81_ATG06772 [Venturia nashicola]